MDKDKMISLIIRLVTLLVIIGICALSLWIAYKISISDLPDWFKFWLLQR